MNGTIEKHQLEILSFLRFPLLVGVVFMHTPLQPGGSLVSECLYLLGSRILPHVCVPLFFIISGFFFFYGAPFTPDTYIGKLKRRARTLLLPYVLWISAWLVFYYFLQRTGVLRLERLVDYDWNHIVSAYWGTVSERLNDGRAYPILGQFWFLRDLMCVILLSPLIFWGLKKLGIIFLSLPAAAWLFDWQNLRSLAGDGAGMWIFDFFAFIGGRGLSLYSIFFFTLGAWFSLRKQNFLTFQPWARVLVLCLFPMFAGVETFLQVQRYIYDEILHRIVILVGVPFVIVLTDILLKRGFVRPKAFLIPSGFFIYALHMPWLALAYKHCILTPFAPSSEGALLLNYLLFPVLVSVFCIGIHVFLQRFFPRLDSLLTGGR